MIWRKVWVFQLVALIYSLLYNHFNFQLFFCRRDKHTSPQMEMSPLTDVDVEITEGHSKWIAHGQHFSLVCCMSRVVHYYADKIGMTLWVHAQCYAKFISVILHSTDLVVTKGKFEKTKEKTSLTKSWFGIASVVATDRRVIDRRFLGFPTWLGLWHL